MIVAKSLTPKEVELELCDENLWDTDIHQKSTNANSLQAFLRVRMQQLRRYICSHKYMHQYQHTTSVRICLTRVTRSTMQSSAYVPLWVQGNVSNRGSFATLPIISTNILLKKKLLHIHRLRNSFLFRYYKDIAYPLTSHLTEIQKNTFATISNQKWEPLAGNLWSQPSYCLEISLHLLMN